MGTNDFLSLPHGYVLQGKKNRYIIDRVLGQGAFGITYLARYKASIKGDIGSGTVWAQVAVKEFFMKDMNTRDGSSGYLNDSSQDSLIGRYRRAFMREARNLSGLHHDNIVNVFEVIEANNTVYLVMEYINGGSLDEYIAAKGHLSEQESIEKMLKLCSAVGCMHEQRLLHLDIKPKNVMLDEDDNLYLIDFGLSKQYTADGAPETSTSIGLGTPGFAPVEQAEHQDGDKKFRATIDIYALGATLYKMLTGNMPPKASQVSDSALDGDNIIPIQLKASGISEEVTSVVTMAMWPSSSKRYQTVADFECALRNVQALNTQRQYEDDHTFAALRSDTATAYNAKLQTIEDSQPISQRNQEHKLVTDSAKESRKVLHKWLCIVGFALFAGLILFLFLSKCQSRDKIPTHRQEQEQIITTEQAIETVEQPDNQVGTNTNAPESAEFKPESVHVALNSISLNKTKLKLEEGATSTLSVRYIPADATVGSTIWKSTDSNVITVSSSGRVTALHTGKATIIATCDGKEAHCDVTVNKKPQSPPRPDTQQNNTPASSTLSTIMTSSPTAVIPSTSSTAGTNTSHEWVDLGLSVKWATCNVGASAPEGYGDYYSWGESVTKSIHSWKTYKYCDGDADELTKYCTKSKYGNNRYTDDNTTLDLSDDVAHIKWGGSWRMPTEKEFKELINNCTWTWTTLNGVNGYKVTSNMTDYSNRSIFLPANGWRGVEINYKGTGGAYWSSSLYTSRPSRALNLDFDSNEREIDDDDRYDGRAVRPVCP